MDDQALTHEETSRFEAGWYQDPNDTSLLRWWNGSSWSDETKPIPPDAYICPIDQDSLSDYPTISSWKTSIGFCVLGYLTMQASTIIIGFLLMLAGSSIFSEMPPSARVDCAEGFSYLVMSVIGALLVLYPASFYPSLFTEKPLAKSPELISLLNILFGGIVFGALWNTNLTKSRLSGKPIVGKSYIVCTILYVLGSALSFAVGALMIVLTVIYLAV